MKNTVGSYIKRDFDVLAIPRKLVCTLGGFSEATLSGWLNEKRALTSEQAYNLGRIVERANSRLVTA